MQGSLLQAKMKATGISLGVWLLTGTVLTLCTLFLWFPKFLFWTDGGFSMLQIVLAVDVVLGPGLMFIIFNPKKSRREQVFDISAVVVVQVCCFLYGLFLMYDQHPVFVSYYNNAFHSVRGVMINIQDPSPEVVESLTAGSPSLLVTSNPTKAQLPRALQLSTKQGIALNAQVELQHPLASRTDEVFADSSMIELLLKNKMPEQLKQVLAEHAQAGQLNFAWFGGRTTNAVLVFDSKATYLGAIELPAKIFNPALVPAAPAAS